MSSPCPDEPRPAELKRHSDLWFEDGSVICRAEDTVFRVHMSQLARHSQYFRDLFSCNNFPDTDSEMDGCPVIVLHDSAQDVANLLTALYDGPTFGNNDIEDFRVVSGILRLATKYIIDTLRDRALAHLSLAWPHDLKAWDTREDLGRIREMESGQGSGHIYPSPIDIISLAHEVDAPSLLPPAFYDLSRYTFSQIFEPGNEEPLARSATSLSMADIQRLSVGKESSQHTVVALIQSLGTSPYVRHHAFSATHRRKSSSSGVCVTAAACRKDFSELVDLATQHYLFDRERGWCDPLYVAEELGQLKGTEFSDCKACARSLESWAARERERIWKLIPLWFRLEGSIVSNDGSMSPRSPRD